MGVELLGIFEDPDHDGLVCLTGNCIRAYIIHADDKNYRWKMTRVGVAEAAGDQRIVSSEVLRAEGRCICSPPP